MDDTKYDVKIGDIGYRINGYRKSEQRTFIPRLSSGDQDESDFDLLRSKSITDFSGGILQRFWDDDTSIFSSNALYPKYDDGVLYPVPEIEASAYTLVDGKGTVDATLVTPTWSYIAYRTYAGVTKIRYFFTYNYALNYVATIPTALQSEQVTDMVFDGDQTVYIFTSGGIYYTDADSSPSGTVTDITAGSGSFNRAIVWNDQIYGTDSSGKSELYRYTGSTSTRSVVKVGGVNAGVDLNEEIIAYNNRIFIFRKTGIYAYDGVQMITIEANPNEISASTSYAHPVVMRGYIYYFMEDGMYRFNGSLIEKLYDVSEVGRPVSVTYGNGRIWLLYANSDRLGSTRFDKSIGLDYDGTDNISGRVMVFNGKGLYTYGNVPVFVKNSGTEDFSGQAEPHTIMQVFNTLFIFTWADKFDANYVSAMATTSTLDNEVITSIYDGGFPMINKLLENIEVLFDGYDGGVGSDDIDVYYRTDNFDNNTGWNTLGTISRSSIASGTGQVDISSDVSLDPTFRQIQVKIYCQDLDSTVGIRGVVIRSLLKPELKLEWNFTALCYGAGTPNAPLLLADGSTSEADVRELRGNIYDLRSSVTPFWFIDIDRLELDGAIDASQTTITVASADLFKGDEGFLKIDNEIIRVVSVNRSTNVFTVERGYSGTTATTHSDTTNVYLIYRVILREILTESVILPDDGSSDTAEYPLPSEISIVIQEV